MFMETVSRLNVTSENIRQKNNIFFGSRLEISTFQTYFTISKTLTDGQFFSVITHWTYTFLSPWALPKMMRYFFLLWLRYFPRKIREDDQNPNTLRNLISYKIRF